jgi:acetyl esterase/lipase
MRVITMTSHEIINVWPSIAPGSETWSHEEIEFSTPFADEPAKQWRGIRNVVTPSMTVYRPTGAGTGAGVIVCPGGGYRLLAYDYEGTDVAEWFAARGVTAFLLKYRVDPSAPDPEDFARENIKLLEAIVADREGWIHTLDASRARAVADGVQALRVVRQRADEFGVDPARLGIIGFSAGAGLAIGVALSDPPDRPDFIAAIYGGDRSDTPVAADAPPLFIVVSQDDPFGLAPDNIRLYQRWIAAGATADLHVFSEGGHGYGMRTLGLTTDQWPTLLERWLEKVKVFEKGA